MVVDSGVLASPMHATRFQALEKKNADFPGLGKFRREFFQALENSS
jgi:hypothetical protein